MAKTRLQLTWYNKDKALIPNENGKYGYTWVEASDPRYCETHTLVYDEYVTGSQTPKSSANSYSELADLMPQEDNLLIRGESGDVLESLTRIPELVDKYVGKVKLVYIDPPFNTAQSFASYEDNLEHSIWLTMMRDRLLHLKKLLAEDGSIWVHLDDVEVHRMRLLMDEVFGADNYVREMIWEKKYGASNNSHTIGSMTDTILVYKKTDLFEPVRLPRTQAMNARYLNPDNDPKGRWKVDNATARHSTGEQQHPSVYGIQNPFTGEMQYPSNNANWYFKQETIKEYLSFWGEYVEGDFDNDELIHRQLVEGENVAIREDIKPLVLKKWSPEIGEHNIEKFKHETLPRFTPTPSGGVFLKVYLDEVSGRVPVNLLPFSEVGHNDSAKKEIAALFPKRTPFSTPKPERLLERIIQIATRPGDIVLDCFAGSGTTAAVAQKMGRRWVTCELLESTFINFTRPRLEMVINDLDAGGITVTKGERVPANGVELPEGVSPEDAAKFTSILNKLVANNVELKKDNTVKKLKTLTKTTRSKDVVNWRGGGGFQIAHLSPDCFDYDPILDRVMLTPGATGEVLVRSVAANLGFELLENGDWGKHDGYYFEGFRGNTLLKVWEGVATVEMVDWLISKLNDGQTMVLAATSIEDGVREHLRKNCKGSRVIAIPDDIFCYQKGGEK